MGSAISLLAQAESTYSYGTSTTSGGSSPLFGILMLAYAVCIILLLWSSIRLFQKAGRKWWEAIIPFYNLYVQLKIVGRPGWWLLLFLIPFVGIIFAIILVFDLAKAFGGSTGTGLLLLFFPFIMMPVMAFSSKYQYQGSIAEQALPNDTGTSTTPTVGPQVPTNTPPTNFVS